MANDSRHEDGVSVSQVVSQCLIMCLVFYLWTSPAIQPVKIMVVLFHEMSHGFMALATGGEVLRIAVTAEEGGACETEGGIAVLIVSAGYLGSMFFGGLLLYLSRFKGCVPVVYTLLTLTIATAIFTVLHDPYSRRFATALAGSFIFLGLLAPPLLGSLFLRLMGTVSCLYSIFDIYWDVLAERAPEYYMANDAEAFSALTGISPHTVGAFWLTISVLYFLCIMRVVVKQIPRAAPAKAKPRMAEA